MYQEILIKTVQCANENDSDPRSDGTAFGLFSIVLNNYKVTQDDINSGSTSEDLCKKIFWQIVTELRMGWTEALDLMQESSAADIKDLLTGIERIEGVYEIENRRIVSGIDRKDYEFYKEKYDLM